MKTTVWATFAVPGLHMWKDARNYLVHPHRHMFHYKVELSVDGLDREVEFIELKERARHIAATEQLLGGRVVVGASCEMLAKGMITELRGTYGARDYCVTVSEDEENGATVTASF